jgi:hypothetical protein
MEAVKRVGFSGLDLKGTPPPLFIFSNLAGNYVDNSVVARREQSDLGEDCLDSET